MQLTVDEHKTTIANGKDTGNIPIHLPGLNGLRAIAAISVLFAHLTISLKRFGLNSFILGTDPNGKPFGAFVAGIGVTIFFTLSGFLITYLLLHEKPMNINIRHFYIRRVLRIWPLYFLYLGIALLTLKLYSTEYDAGGLGWYLFLGANIPFIFGGQIPLIGHYWSLGVEEQFYLFWPWIVKKVKEQWLIFVFVTLAGLLIAAKCYCRYYEITTHDNLPFYFLYINRFDCMILGAIGALVYFRRKEKLLRIVCHPVSQLISWGVILYFFLNRHLGMLFSHEVASVATVFLIIAQSEKRNRIINLNNAVFDLLGKISYGIYVIHPLIIFFSVSLIGNLEDTWSSYVLVYLGITGVTLLASYASYQYFERKFLKVKHKFTTVLSSGNRVN